MDAIRGIENAVDEYVAAIHDLCAKIVELVDRRITSSNRSDQFKRYGEQAGAIRRALDERINSLDNLINSGEEEQTRGSKIFRKPFLPCCCGW